MEALLTPHELVDKLARLKTEAGELTYQDLISEDLTDLDVAALWLALDAYAAAAKQAAAIVGKEWVIRHAEGGAVEVDSWLVYARGSRGEEKCIDEDGFWQAAEDYDVRRWFNPNYAKKGSLPPAVRDTFFEKRKVELPVKEPAAVPLEVLNERRNK